MTKKLIKIISIVLSLTFAILCFCSCAQLKEGADLVGSITNEKPTEASNTESDDGLFDVILQAAEPTPPPSNSALFTQAFKEVLLKAVSQGEQLEVMQFDRLFDPTAKVDNSRSNSTTAVIVLSGDEEGEKMTLTSTALHDAASGDASCTISASEGEETAQSGAVYFTGNDVLLKRADTDKKMIRYPLQADQAASYKLLSPIDRLTRVLSGDQSNKKETGEWEASIDEYMQTIMQTAQESDFTAGEEQASLLNQQQTFPSVRLNLKGEKARELLNGLLTLLEQDANITSLLNSFEEDDSAEDTAKLAALRKDLDTLTADEAPEIVFGITVFSNAEEALGAKINYTIKGEPVALSMMFYKNKYERHNELSMVFKDGATLQFMDKNLSTGGDGYRGEISLAAKEKNGDSSLMSAQSISTNNDAQYSADIDFSTTSTNTDDNGQKKDDAFSGKLSWSQSKNAANGMSGKGTGSFTLTIEDEPQALSFDISLEQVYGDVTIDAPQFIESAGLVAQDRDALFEALDVEKEEYENASVLQRALMTLFILII